MNPKGIYSLFKRTFSEWSQHKAPRLGAALAYYTTFSIAPLLIIVIALVGLVFSQQTVQSRVIAQVQDLVGPQGAQLIQTMIQNTAQPRTTLIASLIGVVTLLLGAMGVFGALQDALNTIWEVEPKPNRGLRGLVRDRLLSFGMVLGIGFLLLVSLVISAALQATEAYFGQLLPAPGVVLEIINLAVSFLIITVLFAMMYKFLPDVEIRWTDVWIGAAFTSLLFVVGKFLIGFYLARGSVASTYGAAGSLVILLLWIYYSAQILLFGAEFTRVYAIVYGSKLVPAPGATPAANPSEARPEGAPPRRGQPPLPAGQQQGRLAGLASRQARPKPQNRALAVLPRRELTYQRGIAALFGLFAGAIIEARILRGVDGCDEENDNRNGNGRRRTK